MSATPNELNLPEGTTIEKALGSLTVEEAQVLYWKFQEISYPAIGLEFRKSEGWVEAMMRRVYDKLGLGDKSIHSLEKTRRLKKYYRTPFQSMIWGDFKKIAEVFGAKELKVEAEVAKAETKATDEQVKAMPAGSGEELPRVDQKPVTDGEVPVVPGFPRRLLLIGISLLLACAVCGFLGWRIVVPMLGNDATATITLTIPVPQDTQTSVPATNTPQIVATETSLPTSTNTAVPPTITGTSTNTPLPTETPTSSIPALFSDDFNNGKSSEWQLISGDEPVIVNGSLTFEGQTTIMMIDQEWTDYELSFYVSNMQCQQFVGSRGLTVGLRVQDANNMVALRINDQDYCGGTWGRIQNSVFDDVPNSDLKLPPVDSNGGRQITIRVQGNTFSTPIGIPVVLENYPTGGIAFISAEGVIVDNVRVTPLTP